jgi:hypothetical protein
MRTIARTIALAALSCALGCRATPAPSAAAHASTAAPAAPAPHAMFSAYSIPPVAPASWSEPEWDLDPANSSGHASDSNSCTSTSAPCLTFAQIASRWTTYAPILQQTTTFRLMSAQTGSSDPIFIGVQTFGATFAFLGVPTTAATGTLAGVVAKTYGTAGSGHPLQATLAAGLVAGQKIVNTTRGSSTAFLFSLVSGTTWNLTQPLSAPTNPPTIHRTEVNTWANGDAYTVETLPKAFMPAWQAQILQFTSGGAGSMMQDVDLIAGPSSPGYEYTNVSGRSAWQDVAVDRIIVQSSSDTMDYEGCFLSTLQVQGPSITQLNTILSLNGGALRSNFGYSNISAQFGNDIIFSSNTQVWNSTYGITGASNADGVYINTSSSIQVGSAGSLSVMAGETVPFYGPGQLNAWGSSQLSYIAGASKAAATFLGPAPTINQGSSACLGIPTASSTTLTCNLTISASTLDTQLGSTTGCLYVPGSASICNVLGTL